MSVIGDRSEEFVRASESMIEALHRRGTFSGTGALNPGMVLGALASGVLQGTPDLSKLRPIIASNGWRTLRGWFQAGWYEPATLNGALWQRPPGGGALTYVSRMMLLRTVLSAAGREMLYHDRAETPITDLIVHKGSLSRPQILAQISDFAETCLQPLDEAAATDIARKYRRRSAYFFGQNVGSGGAPVRPGSGTS